jgi:hypothetical protein
MVSISRWTARIGAVMSLLFLAAFIFGNAKEAAKWPTFVEWIGLALFPAGIIVGLLIAFRRELVGGGIVTLSLLGFYIWHFAVSGTLAAGPWFAFIAAPGLLFLITGLLSRAKPSSAGEAAPAGMT